MIPPITREEKYMYEIVGAGKTAPEKPLTRKEMFYAAILGEDRTVPRPITKEEKYLAALAGAYSEALPPPTTRIEKFLAKAAGMDVETPVPVTREELFWDNYSAVQKFEGIPPIVFTSNGKSLKNYRIYGNTVEGESVGDRTGNLWDENYSDMVVNAVKYISLSVENGEYTISTNMPLSGSASLFLLSGAVISGASTNDNGVWLEHNQTVTVSDNFITIGYRIYSNADPRDYSVMLNSGSTPLPYEPYGYRVPVAINDVTTNLYLPEQIKKVGDEAEYVDFVEQKQYFADGSYADVTLPELPTIAGTNTLSVDTQVQPSKVYVEVGIKTV